MKTILFLGAATFQLPPIEYAASKGYRIITCDNLSGNPGHKLADVSYNVSTVDKEKVLEIASKEKVDGVLAFGSDVSMVTCSYVTNKLNLPGNPLSSVEILVDKMLFRQHLNETGIQPIMFKQFSFNQKKQLQNFIFNLKDKAVLKPVDSSGSKGVSILNPNNKNSLSLIDLAFDESRSKKVIIEDYIEKEGFQICGDGFVENGELKFVYFGDGHFYDEKNFLAPWGETFPTSHLHEALLLVREKVQQIITSLRFHRGPINLDVFITKDNNVFINEIGPRSGGNFIPTVTLLKTNVDMISGAVESCLNENFHLDINKKANSSFYASYMVHSKTEEGLFKELQISEDVQPFIESLHLYKRVGDEINVFTKGSNAIANVILRYDNEKKMKKMFKENIHEFFKVIYK